MGWHYPKIIKLVGGMRTVNYPLQLSVVTVATITQNSESTSTVIATATATDEDGADFTYSISGDDNGYYTITDNVVYLSSDGVDYIDTGADLPSFFIIASSTTGDTSTASATVMPPNTTAYVATTRHAPTFNGTDSYVVFDNDYTFTGAFYLSGYFTTVAAGCYFFSTHDANDGRIYVNGTSKYFQISNTSGSSKTTYFSDNSWLDGEVHFVEIVNDFAGTVTLKVDGTEICSGAGIGSSDSIRINSCGAKWGNSTSTPFLNGLGYDININNTEFWSFNEEWSDYPTATSDLGNAAAYVNFTESDVVEITPTETDTEEDDDDSESETEMDGTLTGLNVFNGISSSGALAGVTDFSDTFTIKLDVNTDTETPSQDQWLYSDWANGDATIGVMHRTTNNIQLVTSPNGSSASFGASLASSNSRDVIRAHYDGYMTGLFVNDKFAYKETGTINNGSANKYAGSKDTSEGSLKGSFNFFDIQGETFTPTSNSYTTTGSNGGELTLANTTFEADAVAPDNTSVMADGYNVIVLAGQSNMVGYVDAVAGIDDDYTDVAGVMQLGYGGELKAATNPLDQEGTESTGMGLWLELVKSIKSTMTDKPILLLGTAKTSSGFQNSNWNEGDDKYNMFRANLNTIMATTNSTLKGVFWLQGEADAYNDNDAEHLSNLTAMWDSMKVNCASIDSDTPFIAGEVLSDGSLINSSLAAFTASLNKGGLALNDDLTDKGDNLHYSAASLRLMGQRMGAAYLAATGD